MENIIIRPKVTLTVDGKSYPVNSAQIRAEIGSVLSFNFTIVSQNNSNSASLTIEDIRDLIAQLQNAVYKDPKKSSIKLSISGDGIKEFNIEGIATSVNSHANTTGGITCTISGASEDILMEMANFSPYLTYANGKTAIDSVITNSARINKIYVDLLPDSHKESTSDSIAQRIRALLYAGKKWREVCQSVLDQLPESTRAAIDEIEESNKAQLSQISQFLSDSNDTTLPFNGEVEINKYTAIAINCGLHNCIYERDQGFLSAIFSVCAMFRLWYLPRIKDKKGKGILVNQKYGDESDVTSTNIYIDKLNYTLGGIWANKPPCKAVAIQANMYRTAMTTEILNNLSPASRIISAIYPETPTRQYGITYIFDADNWICLPEGTTNAKKNIDTSTVSTLANGKVDPGTREASEVEKTNKKTAEVNKKTLDGFSSVLKYLAKKTYYRILLAPSTAYFSGPFTGLDFEVGDMITINTANASNLATGIVSGITISVSASAGASLEVNLTNVKVKGVNVE